MPKESRARTRAARERMTATGQTYTQALTALDGPPGMDRDSPPDPVMTALMFGELMAVGRRAAVYGPGDLAGAAAAVRAAVLPLWPRVSPEAVRDVLVSCAELAAAAGAGLPDDDADGVDARGMITARDTLELAAGHAAAGSPSKRFAPHVAYASSAAFDRDEDAATLDAVCVLIALAHPAGSAGMPADPADEDDDWPPMCPECGGGDVRGTYGCECFNPMACSDCGDPNGDCDCWA
jgi:hypothetical protein